MRGIAVCQDISNEFELHAFNNRTNVRSVIRRDLPRRPRALEPPAHAGGARPCWPRKALKVAVLEAQGALFFGSTEQLLRRLMRLAAETRAT